MDIRDKQSSELNKKAFVMSLIINIAMELISVMLMAVNPSPRILTRIIIILAVTVASFVVYKINPASDKFKHFVNVLAFASYLAFLFTSLDFGLYVFVFPIAILVGVFRDKMLIIIGGVAASAANIAYDIFLINKGIELEQNAMVVQVFVIVLSAVVSFIITDLQQKQTQETLDDIERRAEEQANVARGMIQYSRELSEQFDLAMEASGKLNECMDASNNAVEEIADATRMTAEAVQEQTTQTADIHENIQGVDTQTQEMSRLSQMTKDAVEGGVKLIAELKHQAEEVAKISRDTEVTTRNLNESIQQVADITETINGISAQTNLLALNASIEAARAGEAGKGFAVVADEIRKLSEDTKNATGEINEIISKLMTDAELASKSMSTSAAYADKQNELITTTGEKLDEIKTNSDALYDGVSQVSVAVEQVLNANALINDSISNLSATSEEVAASTENSLTLSGESMRNLQNMNEYLEKINTISNAMREMSE